MEKMKALYEKVAADSGLQARLTVILNKAEEAGVEETEEKLTAFAKEAGFDVSMEEAKAFLAKRAEASTGELDDSELDMVAGGKSAKGVGDIVISVVTLGISCGLQSLDSALNKSDCGKWFE